MAISRVFPHNLERTLGDTAKVTPREEHTGQLMSAFLKGYLRFLLDIDKTISSGEDEDLVIQKIVDYLSDIPWEKTEDSGIDYERARGKIEKALEQASGYISHLLDKDLGIEGFENLKELDTVGGINKPIPLIEEWVILFRRMSEARKRPAEEKESAWHHISERDFRKYFELARKLYLAKYFLKIEFSDSNEKQVRRDLNEMETFLKENIFYQEDGKIVEEEIDITAYLDSRGVCLAVQTPFNKQGFRQPRGFDSKLKFPVKIRYLRMKGGKKGAPVIYESRLKSPYSHLSKMLRERLHSPDEVHDIRAMRFINVPVPGKEIDGAIPRGGGQLLQQIIQRNEDAQSGKDNEWANRQLMDSVTRRIFPSPGTATRVRLDYKERSKYSSPQYEVLKFDDIYRGKGWEVQVQGLINWISAQVAIDDAVNHGLFRLNQHLGETFPDLFPQIIYGINWEDPRVRDNIRDRVIEKAKRQLESKAKNDSSED